MVLYLCTYVYSDDISSASMIARYHGVTYCSTIDSPAVFLIMPTVPPLLYDPIPTVKNS